MHWGRGKAHSAGDDQTDGADAYVGKELTALIFAAVGVDHSADKGVVHGVPDLADQKEQCVHALGHTHELCPVNH